MNEGQKCKFIVHVYFFLKREFVYVHAHLKATRWPQLSSLGIPSTFFGMKFLIGLRLQGPFCLWSPSTMITNVSHPPCLSTCVLGIKLMSSSLWGKHITRWAISLAYDWCLHIMRRSGHIQKHQACTHRQHTPQEDVMRRCTSQCEAFKDNADCPLNLGTPDSRTRRT